jgi:hypothetical protein
MTAASIAAALGVMRVSWLATVGIAIWRIALSRAAGEDGAVRVSAEANATVKARFAAPAAALALSLALQVRALRRRGSGARTSASPNNNPSSSKHSHSLQLRRRHTRCVFRTTRDGWIGWMPDASSMAQLPTPDTRLQPQSARHRAAHHPHSFTLQPTETGIAGDELQGSAMAVDAEYGRKLAEVERAEMQVTSPSDDCCVFSNR